MAVIERITKREEWDTKLRALEGPALIGQQMVQRGAIDALEFLVENGCSQQVAEAMLDSLREGLMKIHEIANERGVQLIGYEDPDQVHGS